MSPSASASDVEALRATRASVLERIGRACGRAHRDPAGVTLVAVSKTVEAARLRDAVTAGLTVLGENRVQEGAEKVPAVPGATWHLIGPLQSNKARRAVEAFDVIESVDSTALAHRIDRIAADVRGSDPGRPYPVLLQVNVDVDPAKAGFGPDAVTAALAELATLANLRIRGLMTIGRLVTDPTEARTTFRALRELSEWLRGGPDGACLGPELSMGMSDDFEIAIEEGATIVRVGRALFGERHVA